MNFNMSITEQLSKIKSELPEHVSLVAVSKTKPKEDLLEAYNVGQRIFGENKIQEMVEKHEQLPKDIQWHMIGHVQRNKVKYMASFVSLIHGVDNFKLLKEINKEAKKHDRIIDCLFQLKIAEEDSKFGMTKQEIVSIINSDEFSEMTNINVVGLMGMATFTDNQNQIKEEFSSLKSTFYTLVSQKHSNFNPKVLSMGMSGDFEIAIECGSTMVRIGSTIFGSRNYTK
jgi:pyridoxal phosphate enzyme (YggS family)